MSSIHITFICMHIWWIKSMSLSFPQARQKELGSLKWQNARTPSSKWTGLCKFSSSWWRHHMETFSALLALCAGNSPVTREFPHKGQWCGALMFSFICAWTNGWENNRDACDLRRNRAHYDVTVTFLEIYWSAMRTSSAHQICEYFKITLCMLLILAPL